MRPACTAALLANMVHGVLARAVLTVNISLMDESLHAPGGRLLAAIDGSVKHIRRDEGHVTIHGSTLLHGVSRCTNPRYSLILFFP